MSRKSLPERLAAWAAPVIDTLETQARQGLRSVRTGAAGPLRVRHTFKAESTHAELLDALIGAPPPNAPEVTIHSLQLNCDPITPPSPPWTDADFDDNGRPLGLQDSPWRLAWNTAGELRCYHRERRVGLFITSGPVKSWELAAPMRLFWHWAATSCGAAMVHGGTIGTAGAMGIVAGPGGTGKSTTVLLGMRHGLRSCGDDYVWLQPNTDGTQAWAVFRTIKTVVGSPLSPRISERVRQTSEAQKQIDWMPQGELMPRAPLRIAWLLRPPNDKKRWPTRVDALAAMLPSTLLQVNGDEPAVTAVLRSVLAAVEVRPLARDGNFDTLVQSLVHDCEELAASS